MVAAELHVFGSITALTFRNPKQITFRESMGIGKKHAASRDVHSKSMVLS